jgi:hypothetical protein
MHQLMANPPQLSRSTWTPLGGPRSSVHLAALIVLFRRSVEPRMPSIFGLMLGSDHRDLNKERQNEDMLSGSFLFMFFVCLVEDLPE